MRDLAQVALFNQAVYIDINPNTPGRDTVYTDILGFFSIAYVSIVNAQGTVLVMTNCSATTMDSAVGFYSSANLTVIFNLICRGSTPPGTAGWLNGSISPIAAGDTANVSLYRVAFGAIVLDTMITLWDTTQSNIIYYGFRTAPGNYIVKAELSAGSVNAGNYVATSFANGCSNSISLSTSIDANTGNCDADFSLLRFQGTTVAQLDTTNIQVARPFTYRWLINGEPTQVQQPFLFFDSIASPVFQITLIVTGNGCEVPKTKNISRNPDAFCTSNFRLTNNSASDPLQLGKVRLDYVADNKDRYSSSFDSQPDWANFEIEAILPYQVDRNGLPTRHITGQLDCRLSTEGGEQSLELRQARFRLALPYKP